MGSAEKHDGNEDATTSRRDLIKKGAAASLVGGLVWSAPKIEGLSLRPSYAAAASGAGATVVDYIVNTGFVDGFPPYAWTGNFSGASVSTGATTISGGNMEARLFVLFNGSNCDANVTAINGAGWAIGDLKSTIGGGSLQSLKYNFTANSPSNVAPTFHVRVCCR